MPHSSGGGSHGNGSHSSSHSSGGSYSSSSSNSYNDSYSRSYSSSSSGSDLSTTVICCIIFAGLAAGIMYIVSLFGIFIPKKIDVQSYKNGVVIEDHVDILKKRDLNSEMEAFLNATGISPAVEVVLDKEWTEEYDNLADFAESEYLRLFDDEKHWLLVFSMPENYQETSFINWHWEGMIGNDCYKAANEKSENLFTETIQAYTAPTNLSSFSEGIASAFGELSTTIMKPQISVFCVVLMVIIGLIGLGFIILFIADYIGSF